MPRGAGDASWMARPLQFGRNNPSSYSNARSRGIEPPGQDSHQRPSRASSERHTNRAVEVQMGQKELASEWLWAIMTRLGGPAAA